MALAREKEKPNSENGTDDSERQPNQELPELPVYMAIPRSQRQREKDDGDQRDGDHVEGGDTLTHLRSRYEKELF